MKKIIFPIILLLTTSACTDTAGFTNRLDDWEAAFNAQDIDTLAGMYTEDARLMPPNAPTMTGHDAVREMFGGMIEQGISVNLETTSYTVALNTAHRLGTYQTMVNGETVDSGKFMETWDKGSGEWLMSNDIWNSDLPPPPPPKPKHEKKREGMGHPHVMIMHEVTDGEAWLSAWRGENSRHELFKANGAMHVHTFQHPENPNLTGLVVAVKDMAALEAMLASDEGQAAATEDGVDLENMSVLMEVK